MTIYLLDIFRNSTSAGNLCVEQVLEFSRTFSHIFTHIFLNRLYISGFNIKDVFLKPNKYATFKDVGKDMTFSTLRFCKGKCL